MKAYAIALFALYLSAGMLIFGVSALSILFIPPAAFIATLISLPN